MEKASITTVVNTLSKQKYQRAAPWTAEEVCSRLAKITAPCVCLVDL